MRFIGLTKQGKVCLPRTKPSRARLAPGRTFAGVHWDYHIVKAIGDNTHQSSVYMAKVVPREGVLESPKLALIKTASPEDKRTMESICREYTSYRLPGVSSAKCFRQMYDKIDDCTIALEWLDTTLADIKYRPNMRTYALIQKCLRAALESCVILENQGHVNTDYKPANILVSGNNTSRIIAKVGDLGLVFPAGHRLKAQPLAMRAPEVFLGQACTMPSQVWAVAAMLLCWIKPNVLGRAGSPWDMFDDAWCMTKIKRLFPNWDLVPHMVDGSILKINIEFAIRNSQEDPSLQEMLPLKEEMQKVEMPQQLRDLLSLMLVTDPDKRPSASAVLASEEFHAFENIKDA